MSLLQNGMGCPDWHTAIHSLRLQRLLRIYCPGHVGVSGNERADRLASTADITSGLQLGRAEVLRGIRNLSEHGQVSETQHWSTEGKKSGEKKWPTVHPPKSGVTCAQPKKIKIKINKKPLGRLLRDGGGAHMALSERHHAILSRNWNWKSRGAEQLRNNRNYTSDCLHITAISTWWSPTADLTVYISLQSPHDDRLQLTWLPAHHCNLDMMVIYSSPDCLHITAISTCHDGHLQLTWLPAHHCNLHMMVIYSSPDCLHITAISTWWSPTADLHITAISTWWSPTADQMPTHYCNLHMPWSSPTAHLIACTSLQSPHDGHLQLTWLSTHHCNLHMMVTYRWTNCPYITAISTCHDGHLQLTWLPTHHCNLHLMVTYNSPEEWRGRDQVHWR